jgi:hypothetical protein
MAVVGTTKFELYIPFRCHQFTQKYGTNTVQKLNFATAVCTTITTRLCRCDDLTHLSVCVGEPEPWWISVRNPDPRAIYVVLDIIHSSDLIIAVLQSGNWNVELDYQWLFSQYRQKSYSNESLDELGKNTIVKSNRQRLTFKRIQVDTP